MSNLLDQLFAGYGGGTPPFNPDAALPGEAALDVPDEEIAVAGWKPKKQSIWKTLGDALVINSGGDAEFAKATKAGNLRDALKDFEHDPVSALNRLRQVDAGVAMDYQGRVADDQRADLIAQATIGDKKAKQEEGALNFAGGLLYTARNKPDTYPVVKQRIESYYKARGLEMPFQLGDSYNEDEVDMIMNGDIGAERLFKLRTANDRTDIARDRVDVQRDSLDERTRIAEARLELMESRLDMQREQGDARIEIARDRAGKGKGGSNEFTTPSGARAVVHPNGKSVGYIKDGQMMVFDWNNGKAGKRRKDLEPGSE